MLATEGVLAVTQKGAGKTGCRTGKLVCNGLTEHTLTYSSEAEK